MYLETSNVTWDIHYHSVFICMVDLHIKLRQTVLPAVWTQNMTNGRERWKWKYHIHCYCAPGKCTWTRFVRQSSGQRSLFYKVTEDFQANLSREIKLSFFSSLICKEESHNCDRCWTISLALKFLVSRCPLLCFPFPCSSARQLFC
jgi:hypothetical protein